MKAFWNERYAQEEYIYGTEPNVFFKHQLDALSSKGKLLLPAEGEGRNAVYAAKVGWQVTGFDQSEAGRQKAMQLAEKNKVSIEYLLGDPSELDFGLESFDAIGFIFAHFSADTKIPYYQRLTTFLKPGGHIILEVFSKQHLQLSNANPAAGGPKDINMLWSQEEVLQSFPGVETLLLQEMEVELEEGRNHVGKSAVIRFLGQKI